MLYILFVSSALAVNTINVKAKFKTWTKNFCPNGKVSNADIGTGNMMVTRRRMAVDYEEDAEAARLGAEHAKLSLEELEKIGIYAGKPSEQADDGLLGSACQEDTGKTTCVKSLDKEWYWCKYPQYKCMSKYAGQYGPVTYFNEKRFGAVPEELGIKPYKNYLDEPSYASLTKTDTVKKSQTIEVTTSYQTGLSMEITAGVPDVFSVKDAVSWKWDWSKKTSKSYETTQTLSFENSHIEEEPGMTTMVQLNVTSETYSGEWRARIKLPYYAKVWCADSINGHHEYFIGAQHFLGDGPYYGKGTFTGGSGLGIVGTAIACPLSVSEWGPCLAYAESHVNNSAAATPQWKVNNDAENKKKDSPSPSKILRNLVERTFVSTQK